MHHHKLFSDKSGLYNKSRPTYPEGVYDYLANLSPSKNMAWDSACGNGQAAIGLAEQFKNVFASDVSIEQISNAKPHPGITYSASPSEKTTLEDNCCDLVCVAQALHWFDLDLFWPEVKRVLKPEGIFAVLGYNWPTISKEIDSAISSFIMEVIEPYWAPQNKLIWNRYEDIVFPFKMLEAPNFDMQVDWNLNEYFDFIHSFSGTRRCMESIGSDFFDAAYEEVASLWGDREAKRTVTLDFVFIVGRNEAYQAQ